MADFGGFTFQTPADIQAQRAAERRQVLAQGSRGAQVNFNIESALDTLFGNPEQRQAQKIQERLTAAEKEVGTSDNPGDLGFEVQRLQRMRDAVVDLDPSLAAQINSQLLKVEDQRQQRDRLLAKDARLARKDEREEMLFPGQLLKQEQDIVGSANEGQNYWNPETGQRMNVAKMDSIKRRALRLAGWVEGSGPTTEAEAGKFLPNKVATDTATALLNAQTQLDQLASVAAKWNPKWMTYTAQAEKAALAIAEKAGMKLSPEKMKDLQEYNDFRANSIDGFNNYIRSITGAAMAVTEAERIQLGYPDVRNDSASEFIGKTRATVRKLLQIQKRAQDTIAQGIVVPSDNGGAAWEKIALPPVSETEVDAAMNMYFGVPLPAGSQQPGVPDAQGWTTAPNGVRIRKKG